MNDMVKHEAQDASPIALLRLALDQGADLDRLERLMLMQERHEANAARKLFVEDMAKFKANPPTILKDKEVRFTNSKGDVTQYMHSELATVCNAVIAGLAEHNLYHRWIVEQPEQRVRVTCVITHTAGHSEQTTMESMVDASGGKNPIQAISSAVTYLQRYTLLAACGLATQAIKDDDGRGAGDQVETISEEQVASVSRLLELSGTNAKNFLDWLKVESIEQISVQALPAAVQALEQKLAKKRKVKEPT